MSLRLPITIALPGALAALPVGLWLAAPEHPGPGAAAVGYPYAVLAAAALLGWRFQRSRLVSACLVLALAGALAPPPGTPGARLGAALLAPLLALLALSGDRRLAAPRGLLQLALGPLAVAAIALGLRDPARATRWMERMPAAPVDNAVAAGLVGIALLLLVALRRGRALEAGLLWAAVAGTLALRAPEPARGLWLLGGALALGLALVEAAHALAFRDELTDLPGRRALGSLLAGVRSPYAVAIVDVDHFKRFNDRHGHDVGDQVLRMVAARLGAVGGGGRAFRSGGEEFTIVFPGCTREEAIPHLEEMRRAVAASPFVPRRALRSSSTRGAARRGRAPAAKKGLRVTVSVGVAAGGGSAASPEQVVKSADKAMYRAKQSGRNRVMA